MSKKSSLRATRMRLALMVCLLLLLLSPQRKVTHSPEYATTSLAIQHNSLHCAPCAPD
ncbi:MAG: hypothetical protein NZM04_09285 [Methylacidiphilales bacterium]|nr:hypothetical protein [Candidatus Methylacidiphilales bacterium]